MAEYPDEVLAVIPARGGSKGIPLKNIIPFCGKPLIAWSIENALRAKCVSRVVVSTDDDKISEISIAHGAEVIKRPDEISGDFDITERALIHVLDRLDESEQYKPDWLVFLQCTSPLLTADDIDAAFEIASVHGYDSVFSAYAQHFMGRWQKADDDTVQPVNYDPARRPMRQEVKQEFVENGALYVLRPESLRQNNLRFGRRNGVYVMPLERSFQIDTEEDVYLVEKLFDERCKRGQDISAFSKEKIKLVIVDFDGTMTDNRVIVDEDGREQVACNRSDGWGVRMLKNAGIDVVCLTSEENPVVLRRCEKLKIECINGVLDKEAKIREMLAKRNLTPGQAAFVCNDINDIPAMNAVGLPIAVGDAHIKAKRRARLILSKCGGQGVLLEVAEMLTA